MRHHLDLRLLLVSYHLSYKIGSHHFMNLLLDHKLIDVVLESVLMYVLKVLVDFRLMLEAKMVMLMVLVCLHHWHWGLLFFMSVGLFNDKVLIFELILVLLICEISVIIFFYHMELDLRVVNVSVLVKLYNLNTLIFL
jgi:hypothetical protein